MENGRYNGNNVNTKKQNWSDKIINFMKNYFDKKEHIDYQFSIPSAYENENNKNINTR